MCDIHTQKPIKNGDKSWDKKFLLLCSEIMNAHLGTVTFIKGDVFGKVA